MMSRVSAVMSGRTLRRESRPKAGGTPTEAEVMVLKARIEAGSRAETARRLGMSDHTVRNHLESLFEKVGAVSIENCAWLCWRYIGADIGPVRDRRRSARRAADREGAGS